MTNKIYKTAQGKVVDLGALILQNEKVRAVGNMNVNARGDILDSANKVILQKNKQVQQQYVTKSNVTADRTVHASNTTAKKQKTATKKPAPTQAVEEEIFQDVPTADPVDTAALETTPVEPVVPSEAVPPESVIHSPRQLIPQGGLAGAIARSKLIKQEKEKTLRQLQQQQGLKKI